MPRKPKVQRTPEEKWLIVLEGLKSGNVAETCRKYEIAPTLYYRWKGLTGVVAWPGGWGGITGWWSVCAVAANRPSGAEPRCLGGVAFRPRGAGLTLTTDNGTQFTSARYVETLNQLGITHRRTAYNHPEGNSYIVRFHRSLKEEEVWLNECQNFDQAELSIASWIEEYNHDRPHRRLRGRTSHESRAQFLAQTRKRRLCTVEALCLGCPSFRGISAIVSFRLPKSRLLVRRESGLAHNFRVARDSGRIGPILPKGAHKQN